MATPAGIEQARSEIARYFMRLPRHLSKEPWRREVARLIRSYPPEVQEALCEDDEDLRRRVGLDRKQKQLTLGQQ